MTDDQIDAYVRATLALQGYKLDDQRTDAIVTQFERIAAIARPMLDMALAHDSEPAALFRP